MKLHHTFAKGNVVSRKLALTGEPILVAGDNPETDNEQGCSRGRWFILTPLDVSEDDDLGQLYAELSQHDPTAVLFFQADD